MADSSRLLNTGWYCWWNVSRIPMVTPKRTTGPATAQLNSSDGRVATDLGGAYIDLNAPWHAAELDPSALNGEIQTVAGEVQARDLQALPQHRLDRSDPQPSARRTRLEPEQRCNRRASRGGAPGLRPAAGVLLLRSLSGRPPAAGHPPRPPPIPAPPPPPPPPPPPTPPP